MALVGFTLIVYAFVAGPLAPPPSSASGVPLKASSTTDKGVYPAGEAVNVTVTVQNVGQATANLSVGCNAFAFRVEDLQGTPYYDSADAFPVCSLVLRSVSLAPGASTNATFRWDQTTTTGQPVPRGRVYRVVPLVSFPQASVVEADSVLIFLA